MCHGTFLNWRACIIWQTVPWHGNYRSEGSHSKNENMRYCLHQTPLSFSTSWPRETDLTCVPYQSNMPSRKSGSLPLSAVVNEAKSLEWYILSIVQFSAVLAEPTSPILSDRNLQTSELCTTLRMANWGSDLLLKGSKAVVNYADYNMLCPWGVAKGWACLIEADLLNQPTCGFASMSFISSHVTFIFGML